MRRPSSSATPFTRSLRRLPDPEHGARICNLLDGKSEQFVGDLDLGRMDERLAVESQRPALFAGSCESSPDCGNPDAHRRARPVQRIAPTEHSAAAHKTDCRAIQCDSPAVPSPDRWCPSPVLEGATTLQARAAAFSTPSGVSIMIHSGNCPAPAAAVTFSISFSCAIDSTFGNSRPWIGRCAIAAMSSTPQGVSRPLTRTTSSR